MCDPKHGGQDDVVEWSRGLSATRVRVRLAAPTWCDLGEARLSGAVVRTTPDGPVLELDIRVCATQDGRAGWRPPDNQ